LPAAERNPLTQPLLTIDTVYHRIAASGPRKPRPHYTTLIEIDPKRDPGGPTRDNICAEREFLGYMLSKLAGAGVAAVAIDKHFRATGCPSGDPGTATLRRGAGALCGAGIPLTVGRSLIQAGPQSFPAVEPGLDLSETTGSCKVLWGIDNTNPDNRRVPLTWLCQRVDGRPGDLETYPGFAMAAARSVNLMLEKSNNRLYRLAHSGTHPFTSFVRAEQWDGYRLTAGEAVCGHAIELGQPWQACATPSFDGPLREMLRGRLVVVGEVSPLEDEHAAVIGNVPGYILQANFVESILDDRLFVPVPETVNYLSGFIFFALFEYIREGARKRGVLRTLLLLSVLVLSAALVVYIVILHLGYYLNPAAVSVIFVVIRVAGLGFDKARLMPPTAEGNSTGAPVAH
jgi:hypothetical protein